MRWILLKLAKLARLRRRVLGKKTPHWFTDATALGGYVNIFSVGLAIFAIASAPDHFFRRLPQYIQRKKSWLPTPLKFFTSSVTLMAAILAASNNLDPPDTIHMSPETTRWVVAGIFVLTPLLMPALCALLIPIDLLAALLMAGDPMFQFIGIPLSLSTYTRLDAVRYLWSMLYFGVYNFVIWQFLFIVGFFTWVTFRWLLYIEHVDSLFSLLWGLPLLILVWTPFFIMSLFFLVRPYIELLTQSLIVPTKLVLRIFWDDLRKAVVACEQMARGSHWDVLEKSIPALRTHVESFSAINDDTSRLREFLVSGTLAPSVLADINSLLDQLDHVRSNPDGLYA